MPADLLKAAFGFVSRLCRCASILHSSGSNEAVTICIQQGMWAHRWCYTLEYHQSNVNLSAETGVQVSHCWNIRRVHGPHAKSSSSPQLTLHLPIHNNEISDDSAKYPGELKQVYEMDFSIVLGFCAIFYYGGRNDMHMGDFGE